MTQEPDFSTGLVVCWISRLLILVVEMTIVLDVSIHPAILVQRVFGYSAGVFTSPVLSSSAPPLGMT